MMGQARERPGKLDGPNHSSPSSYIRQSRAQKRHLGVGGIPRNSAPVDAPDPEFRKQSAWQVIREKYGPMVAPASIASKSWSRVLSARKPRAQRALAVRSWRLSFRAMAHARHSERLTWAVMCAGVLWLAILDYPDPRRLQNARLVT